MNLGAVDLCFHNQPLGVHQQMSLLAPNLLASVVAALLPAHPGGLGRLGVDDACARSRVPTRTSPQALSQGSVEPLPCPIDAPLSEPIVDALPRWEVAGQEPPRAATL